MFFNSINYIKLKCFFICLDCRINVNDDFPDPQPLILVPGTPTFRQPRISDGTIHLNTTDQIELFCSNEKTDIAVCINDTQFEINTVIRQISSYTCDQLPQSIVRRTGRQCYNDNSLLEVGFLVGNDSFAKLYEVCHNDTKASNSWVYYHISPANNEFQHNFSRPNFRVPPGFFNEMNVDQLYTKNNQRDVFSRILGSVEVADNWIQSTGDSFLARGHLVAKTDFIFGSQQSATFWFVNAAPQWQSFNAGNWERVESSIRTLAADRQLYLDVYTGTYDVLQIHDLNGILQDMYLHVDGDGGLIPVPKIFYKVIIDIHTRNGIAIIGVNNPRLTENDVTSYILCNDIADKIHWIDWDAHNFVKGYMYACEVNEFIDATRQLPILNMAEILV